MLSFIIDGSYYIFHRYYATKRWCSLQPPEAAIDFEEAFFRQMLNDFRNWRRKYIHLTEILFALDCPREDIWRREIYPEYKATRTHASDFDRDIFTRVYDFLDRERNHLQVRMIKHPKLEADDICYILTKCEALSDCDRIVIIANDNDYLQLCNDRISVVNKEGREIKERGCGDAQKDLMRKVLMGDKSDNIPAVCTGIGPKTADKLIALSPNEFTEWLSKKGPAAVSNFERNKKLIDMTNIPQDLVDELIAQENLMRLS